MSSLHVSSILRDVPLFIAKAEWLPSVVILKVVWVPYYCVLRVAPGVVGGRTTALRTCLHLPCLRTAFVGLASGWLFRALGSVLMITYVLVCKDLGQCQSLV